MYLIGRLKPLTERQRQEGIPPDILRMEFFIQFDVGVPVHVNPAVPEFDAMVFHSMKNQEYTFRGNLYPSAKMASQKLLGYSNRKWHYHAEFEDAFVISIAEVQALAVEYCKS